MAISKPQRVLGIALIATVAFLGIAIAIWFFTRPPQMGASEEVFNTVDALYTAVRSRDEKQLNDCADRLKGLKTKGELPDSAAKSLEGIIAECRSGGWDSSARNLYEFMLAQRREGFVGTPKTREAKKR